MRGARPGLLAVLAGRPPSSGVDQQVVDGEGGIAVEATLDEPADALRALADALLDDALLDDSVPVGPGWAGA